MDKGRQRLVQRASGRWALLVIPCTLLALPEAAEAFGLACWTHGTDYHRRITRVGAQRAGFSPQAAELLAWHATMIDLYHEHPVWPVRRFVNRQWDRLHFDDLFSTPAVLAQWRRLVRGTFYGLRWAAENGEPLAAATLLGVALHGLEDFFSHSNWVDEPERRRRTPFDYRDEALHGFDLWTGAWGRAAPDGRRPHGGRGSDATARVVGASLGAGCSCRLDEGINLDRPCSAMAAAENRDTPDAASWRTLFDAARARARDAATELLRRLGRWMRRSGHAAFWRKLRRLAVAEPLAKRRRWSGSTLDPAHPRSFGLLPWGFLSGGAYPSEPGWYLRVEVETADGTDGDVVVAAAGTEHALDRPAYDDFERGDDDTYVVGPFPARFQGLRLRLRNRGRSPSWRVRRLRVWAFRLGGAPACGALLDVRDLRLDDDAANRAVRLPAPLPFRVSAFR